MLSTEVVHGFDEKTLRDILQIEGSAFPSDWQIEDAEANYSDLLADKDSINVFLKSNDKRIGYLLAVPHNKVVVDLKDDDPGMKEDVNRYYIYTLGIIPEFRRQGGLYKMLCTLKEECKKRGIHKISMHARVENGLSKRIQQTWKVSQIRRIDRWKYYNYQEPTDYIEAVI